MWLAFLSFLVPPSVPRRSHLGPLAVCPDEYDWEGGVSTGRSRPLVLSPVRCPSAQHIYPTQDGSSEPLGPVGFPSTRHAPSHVEAV